MAATASATGSARAASVAAAAVLVAVAVAVAASVRPAAALDNGLGRTPVMGWLSWERYACQTDCKAFPNDCINEDLYLRQAKALVEGGYADAGYRLVAVDDCWPAMERTADGQLQADPERFPHGMAWLAEQVHGMGLQLGIYLDIGTKTCGGYPGFGVPSGPLPPGPTKPQFVRDAELMASWGIDAIKVDGCNADPATMNVTYPRLGQALNATGRPILYACSWPDYVRPGPVPLAAVARSCNYARTFSDVSDWFHSVRSIATYWSNHSDAYADTAGPGAFWDPDMLMIGGTGLSHQAEQLQMALWAVWAAPMLMSNDLDAVTNASRAVLLNREAVAVSQDPLGRMGRLAATSSPGDDHTAVWYRELQGGRVAVVLANLSPFGGPASLAFKGSDVGLPAGAAFDAHDIFSGEPVGSAVTNLAFDVLSSSGRFIMVEPAGAHSSPPSRR